MNKQLNDSIIIYNDLINNKTRETNIEFEIKLQNISFDLFKVLSDYLPNLQSLTIDVTADDDGENQGDFDTNGLELLLKNTKLTHFNLCGFSIADGNMLAKTLTTLTCLELQYGNLETVDAILLLVMNPKLESMCLTHCRDLCATKLIAFIGAVKSEVKLTFG